MSENFVIAVSGSPGTGKSTFSQLVARELDCRVVDLNEIIEDENIYELDTNGTKLVDPKELQKSFDREVGEDEDIVVDGLLSHLLPPDHLSHIVVLRTHPDTLKDRLEVRNYSEKKLKENIEAEALGVVLSEAIEKHGTQNVLEIDTTDLDPEKAVEYFKKALKGEKSLKPGSIDWLEDYLEIDD